MDIVLLILCGLIGYLIGSVNTSLVISRLYGVDIRTKGSGNAGLTNTLRVLGKRAALFVLLGDVLKGVIACLIGLLIMGQNGLIVAGTFSVVGHNWPVYFHFKGGKGILTSATVVFMLDWKIGLIALTLFIIVVALTRYVSLGSILAAISVPIGALVADQSWFFFAFTLIIAFLAIYRHKDNIVRLYKGKENKLSFKK